jgi:hypothetical protein
LGWVTASLWSIISCKCFNSERFSVSCLYFAIAVINTVCRELHSNRHGMPTHRPFLEKICAWLCNDSLLVELDLDPFNNGYNQELKNNTRFYLPK